MGMFDYIKSEIPLPSDPKPPDIEWYQTKDVPTDQLYLEHWIIKSDGRLLKVGVRYEDHSDKSAPSGSLESIMGIMTPVPDASLDKFMDEFHGDISFGHYDSDTKEYWDYIARFTEGKCTKIWCSRHEPPESLNAKDGSE